MKNNGKVCDVCSLTMTRPFKTLILHVRLITNFAIVFHYNVISNVAVFCNVSTALIVTP